MRGRTSYPERVRRAPRVTAYDWRQALTLAGRLATEAQDESGTPPEGFGGRLAQLKVWAADLTAEGFPMASVPARLLAGGWLNWTRAFAHSELGAEARTACAGSLASMTQQLATMVDLHIAAVTRASSRATGERDE